MARAAHAALTRRAAHGARLAVALLLGACAAPEAAPGGGPRLMRLGVIGDSDSHAYQDSLTFAPGSPERGGPHRAVTLQWTEVLQRLRADTLDQGAWGTWGRSARSARIAGWVGVALRSPRKQDHEYNVSYSGARCAHVEGPRGQLAQLLHLVRAADGAWRDGAVVIRIGINDIGRREVLDEIARGGLRDTHLALADACTRTIVGAADSLLAAEPALRIVLVGIADNANWPPNFDAAWGAAAVRDIRALQDRYDAALRAHAERTPRVAFLEDRGWLTPLLGGRGEDGVVVARTFDVAGRTLTLSKGDDPSHAYVADGHAGTVVNTLFAQRLVRLMVERFGAAVPPIADAERDAFLRTLLAR